MTSDEFDELVQNYIEGKEDFNSYEPYFDGGNDMKLVQNATDVDYNSLNQFNQWVRKEVAHIPLRAMIRGLIGLGALRNNANYIIYVDR